MQFVKERIDSFQAELEELDPLPLGNESGSKDVVNLIHCCEVCVQLGISRLEVWEVGGIGCPGKNDFGVGALGRLARICLAEMDESFLFVKFGGESLHFCSKVLGRLHKVFMYSERRLVCVCVCLLAGCCEVWVLLECVLW